MVVEAAGKKIIHWMVRDFTTMQYINTTSSVSIYTGLHWMIIIVFFKTQVLRSIYFNSILLNIFVWKHTNKLFLCFTEIIVASASTVSVKKHFALGPVLAQNPEHLDVSHPGFYLGTLIYSKLLISRLLPP